MTHRTIRALTLPGGLILYTTSDPIILDAEGAISSSITLINSFEYRCLFGWRKIPIFRDR